MSTWKKQKKTIEIWGVEKGYLAWTFQLSIACKWIEDAYKQIRFPKADVPQSVFSLSLSWTFENGATLRKVWPGIYCTVRYTLCLQVGVGLYVGVGLDPTLRLGSDKPSNLTEEQPLTE